jgi:FolB domain-containing protein
MDQIIISDLLVRGIIGVNDWERKSPGYLIKHHTLHRLEPAGKTDDIHDRINYRTIAKPAQAHAESAGRFTVEL